MAILFAGGELEAFTQFGSASTDITMNNGRFDVAYARSAMAVGNGNAADNIATPIYAPLTTHWLHFEFWSDLAFISSGRTLVELRNNSAAPVFRLLFLSATTSMIQPQYWNGTSWVDIGASCPYVSSLRIIVDLEVVCGASGSMRMFVNNSLVSSGSANMAAVNNIAQTRLFTIGAGNTNGFPLFQSTFSQVIVADENTIGHVFHLKPPTAAGANAAFTGTFADVDEVGINDLDFIQSNNANEVETFTGPPLTISPDAVVKAVVVSARAKIGLGGPQNMQFALRRGGADYFGPNVTGIATGYAPFVGIFAQDPSTSASWTPANAAAAATEFGIKSIA